MCDESQSLPLPIQIDAWQHPPELHVLFAQHASLAFPHPTHCVPLQVRVSEVQVAPAQHRPPVPPHAWHEPPEQTLFVAWHAAPPATQWLLPGSQQSPLVHVDPELPEQHTAPVLPHATHVPPAQTVSVVLHESPVATQLPLSQHPLQFEELQPASFAGVASLPPPLLLPSLPPSFGVVASPVPVSTPIVESEVDGPSSGGALGSSPASTPPSVDGSVPCRLSPQAAPHRATANPSPTIPRRTSGE
jgi:hypothetical protein